MLAKIVVGYAGDRAGQDAVSLAGTIAATAGGRLTVVFPYHPIFASRDAEQEQEMVAAEVTALLAPDGEQAASPAESARPGGHPAQPDADAPAQPAFRWSPSPWPIHALHEIAAYEESDLIVFGAAKNGLADRLHVSLMERMVHSAPCAVAVAPSGYEPRPLRQIGVGFAGSREGRAAAALALALAEMSAAQVTMIAGAGLEPALAGYSFSSPALGDIQEEIYAETVAGLERFCAELPEETSLRQEVIRGDPAEVLIDASGRLDLLVLGSRAYGPLRHVLLGSVSARVMRAARCPVLVVPRVVAGRDERTGAQGETPSAAVMSTASRRPLS